ncbi:MAG: phosphoglucomutase/phosphomannomutase family protein [Dehalococcoidia bacterium]
MAIKFGTDGWRAIIGEEYTFQNVKICAQGVANYLKSNGYESSGLIIGYDTRLKSAEFAESVAEVIAGNNIPVILCDRPTPTPVVSYNLVQHECSAGIVITASHNPPNWNGFKFKPGYGGSASPDIVKRLEEFISIVETTGDIQTISIEDGLNTGLIEKINPDPSYMNHIAGMVNLKSIRDAGLNVVIDSMHGAGATYISRLVEGGTTKIFEIRSEINTSFPDMAQPEPIESNLIPLKNKILEVNGDVGLATDGDADRLGIIDEDGQYISTLHAFALICNHILTDLNMTGPIIKSITMTSMIDKLGELNKTPVITTPVGFKYLGPVMIEENAMAAGEESGGYAFQGHIPERDGILSGLMILNMMASTGKNPSELIHDLEEIVGPHFYSRIDTEFDPQNKIKIIEKVSSIKPKHIAGIPVIRIDNQDGFKFILENNNWGLIRFSGTEPLMRIYAEGIDKNIVSKILSECQSYASL